MSISNQIVLILSALGSINGFILALYLWRKNSPTIANKFLSAMLVMVSIRTLKSVLFFFNPDIAKSILQIGLSSCLLIGPFLYFFCLSHLNKLDVQSANWKIHLLILFTVIILVGFLFPYAQYRELWGGVYYRAINIIWLGYLLLSGYLIYPVIKAKQLNKRADREDIWLLSAFTGNFVVWLAYFTASYTSYIVGAMSFTFILSLGVLAIIFKQSDAKEPVKYASNKIASNEAKQAQDKLHQLMVEEELFRNPMITMPKLAKRMAMSTPKFSQLLNDNLAKSFSTFINEYRIEHATKLLTSKDSKTIESIAEDCGFNSLSTFYSTFKKTTGVTPAKYKANSQLIPVEL